MDLLHLGNASRNDKLLIALQAVENDMLPAVEPYGLTEVRKSSVNDRAKTEPDSGPVLGQSLLAAPQDDQTPDRPDDEAP